MENVELEFPPRIYTKGHEPKALKSITHYAGDSKLFEAMFDALTATEVKTIRDSSVGVFLKFHNIEFGWASRIVHYMLGFQLQCKKKFEIWSLIGVNPIRFSLHEFEHITGLACHYVEHLEHPNVLVTKEMEAFWELLGIPIDLGPSVEDLKDAFARCEKWSPHDRLRLGYLAVYAGYIEGRRPESRTRVNLARLVMDFSEFNDYPWGRVAFKNVIQSVKSRNLEKNYALDGFVQVLQVWVYFALKDFGAEFGEPIPHFADNAEKAREVLPLLAFKGARNKRFFKEGMLKESNFITCVVTESFDDMFPKWDNDDDDVKCDNILRAMYCQEGKWQWTWSKEHWPEMGLKMSVNVKPEPETVFVETKTDHKRSLDPKEESINKKPRVESESSVVGDVVSIAVAGLKAHVDACFADLSRRMLEGLQSCEKNLGDRLTSCEKQISLLAERISVAEGNIEADKSAKKEDASPKEEEHEEEHEASTNVAATAAVADHGVSSQPPSRKNNNMGENAKAKAKAKATEKAKASENAMARRKSSRIKKPTQK